MDLYQERSHGNSSETKFTVPGNYILRHFDMKFSKYVTTDRLRLHGDMKHGTMLFLCYSILTYVWWWEGYAILYKSAEMLQMRKIQHHLSGLLWNIFIYIQMQIPHI